MRQYQFRFVSAALVAAAVALASPVPAAQLNSGGTTIFVPQNNATDLQMLQNRLQRQQFQQQQQQLRQQDRQLPPQPAPQVPQIKPSCQLPSYGGGTVNNCR